MSRKSIAFFKDNVPLLGRWDQLAPKDQQRQAKLIAAVVSMAAGVGLRRITPQERERTESRRRSCVNKFARLIEMQRGTAQ